MTSSRVFFNLQMLVTAGVCVMQFNTTMLAQIKGPIEATVGDSKIKMEYGNNANAPKADEVVVNKGNFHPNGNEWLYNQWSWITWWQANKHNYLRPAQGLTVDKNANKAAELALVKTLTQSKNPNLISASTLALGRMKTTGSITLITALLDHEDYHIRRAAWLAMALIDTKQSMEPFLDFIPKPGDRTTPPDQESIRDVNDVSAWIIGIGLMQKPDPKLVKALLPFALRDDKAVFQTLRIRLKPHESFQLSRIAMWSIRMANPPGLNTVAWKLLRDSADPHLFDEAIQSLAQRPDEALVLNTLEPIFHNRPSQFRELPRALGSLMQLWPKTTVELSQAIAAMRTSTVVAYANKAIRRDPRLVRLVTRDLERSYQLISLATRPDAKHATAGQRLFKTDMWRNHGYDFYLPTQDTVGYALRFGLITLGKLGDANMDRNDQPTDLTLLCDVLRGRFSPISDPTIGAANTEVSYSATDPSRGFAALGLGLYLRRLPSASASVRNDNLRSTVRYAQRLLTRIASDPEEPSNLRAACVLAIGLGQTATASQDLRKVLQNMQHPDPLIAGFATLSLGMLHDPMATQLATQAFVKKLVKPDVKLLQQAPPTKPENLLASLIQCAIVDGLACLSEPKANVLLYPRLLDNRYTSRRMIVAMHWSADPYIAPVLLQLLEKPGSDPQHAVFAAWALGELYDPNTVPMMTQRLLLNRNLTLLQPTLQNTGCGCRDTDEQGRPTVLFSLLHEYLKVIDPLTFGALIKSPRG